MRALPLLLTALAAELAAFAPLALAQPSVIVDGVLMPAWVERDGQRQPLTVGMELRRGDKVRTGNGSRVLLKLIEGSFVRLGQNGFLEFNEVTAPIGGLFRASLRVADGAFRFTTDRLTRSRRRDVAIQVASVTAVIRGTDIWGKSTRDRQTVCLIEGKVAVGAEGEAPVTMDQARQFYRREKGVTQPVGLVNAGQLAEWSRETEITAGGGAARPGGTWRVTLASASTESAAADVYERLRTDGFAAEIELIKYGDRAEYNVVIANLPSREDAEKLAAKLRGQHGVGDPKITR